MYEITALNVEITKEEEKRCS